MMRETGGFLQYWWVGAGLFCLLNILWGDDPPNEISFFGFDFYFFYFVSMNLTQAFTKGYIKSRLQDNNMRNWECGGERKQILFWSMGRKYFFCQI